MDKSPDAFRTISEVADSLETPAHVLRFWESRFPQIKPVKRAGGRRYYRPADVALLGGIRHLLHDEGMTIRGVQKILREQGVRHVAALVPGGSLAEFEAEAEVIGETVFRAQEIAAELPEEPETAQVFALDGVLRKPSAPVDTPAEVVTLRNFVDGPDLSDGFVVTLDDDRPKPPPEEDVPEAGHIWVEDEGDLTADPALPLFAAAWREAPAPAEAEPPEAEPDEIEDEEAKAPIEVLPEPNLGGPMHFIASLPHDLTAIAARLRALSQPVSPEVMAELNELHSRLGLLHAQMAEAVRLRR